MKKHRRKLLSALLALALFTTTVPVAPVMAAQESGHTQTLPAEDGTGDQLPVDVGDTNEPTGPIDGNQYWDKEDGNWVAKEIPPNATEIKADNLPTTWNEGYYIVREPDVTINDRVYVTGDVHLILADGASLTANDGIQVQDDDSDITNGSPNSLTIYGQTEGTGALSAAGSGYDAGIGSDKGRTGGNITINGGIVTATNSGTGAAIGGGGERGNGGNTTINGGTVTATGGSWGAGIGGGEGGDGGTITITGGDVTASGNGGAGIGGGGVASQYTGSSGGVITIEDGKVVAKSNNGAGIGGGEGGTGVTITIEGGSVESESSNAAGIGGGARESGGTIVINGGNVTATGKGVGAGIGGGERGDGGSITISGGTVTATGEGTGAGIGGGNGGAGGTITINGGKVTATGGEYSAGIGGGYAGAGGNIIITGGMVTATGDRGAGIGGGIRGYGGNITINDGTVTATGKSTGAGIGGGESGDGGSITISGGTVTANGSEKGAGIGGGFDGGGGSIAISGGTVTATGGTGAAGIGGGDQGGDGTFSTGENGQAVIVASSISDKDDTNGWSGIIIEGNNGQLYGSSVTLTKNFTIPENTTLTIPENTTLTIPENVTLTNNGTIINRGTINGNIEGTQPIVPVKNVRFEQPNITLNVGKTEPLTVMIEPANATIESIAWSSDNPDAVTVSSEENATTATLTAVGEGTATITVIVYDGVKEEGHTATCNVTVKAVPVTGVALDKTSLSLTEGESEQLTATVMPENATHKAVTWTSSDPSIATVDADGTVKAVNAGTATITVTTVDGDFPATCTVTVEEPPFTGHYTYPVNVAETEHGSILLAKENHYAADGEKVSFTVVPDEGYATDTVTVTTKAGKDVAVTDEGEGIYTFTMPTSEVTLAATFVETEEPEPELPFTDVSEDDWFYDPVRWAFLEGLMTGTSDTEFSPNLATTRGMIVSVLYRLEGNPDLSDDILGYPYEDVNPDDWYAMPVYWARLHGIVSGYSDSQFGPNDAITREQLAAILMNYADYKGMDVSARADLSGYSDADTISSWATDTMQWAVAEGYISGMTADTLEPQGSTTRAQVAAIFQRFLEGE